MPENFANDFRTTLAGSITSGATTLILTSATGVGINAAPAAPFRIRIDDELILVGARAGVTCSSLTRGIEDTTAASHSAGAVIRQVLTVAGLTEFVTDAAAEGTVSGPAVSTDRALVRWDGAGGDALEDTDLIAESDGRISGLVDPTGLQDAATKNYVDDAIAAAVGGDAAQSSFLISGGQIVWVSDYEFIVSSATYYINGVLYTSPETTITLDAAHATLDRIDVIAVTTSSTAVDVTGTAAATPSEPDVDPSTQLKLGIILVDANTTEPPDVDTDLVYAENAGTPTEWAATSSHASIVVNSAANPRAGTTAIRGTNVVTGSYVEFANGSPFDPNDFAFLLLYVAPSTWANTRGIQVTFRSGGIVIGIHASIQRGNYNFDNTDSSYQQVAIPISHFVIPPGVTIDTIRMATYGGAISFDMDDVSFQGGAVDQPLSGLTQEQADARYLQRSNNLSDLASAATARTNLGFPSGTGFVKVASGTPSAVAIRRTVNIVIGNGSDPIETGVAGYIAGTPFAGTIVGAYLVAKEASSDIVVDVWKASAGNIPTNGNAIAGSAEPELSNAQYVADTTLSGWTTSVAAGDVWGFNVDSVDGTVTQVTLTIQIDVTG